MFSCLFSRVTLLARCPSDLSSIVAMAETRRRSRRLTGWMGGGGGGGGGGAPRRRGGGGGGGGGGGDQCRKCFTRSLCGSETAFGSWGTWSWGRFRGSRTDRFLLMLSTVLRQKSLTRASHFKCWSVWLVCLSARIFITLSKTGKCGQCRVLQDDASPPIRPPECSFNHQEAEQIWTKNQLLQCSTTNWKSA